MIAKNSKLKQPHPSFLQGAHRPAPLEQLPPASSVLISEVNKLGHTANSLSTDFFTAHEHTTHRSPSDGGPPIVERPDITRFPPDSEHSQTSDSIRDALLTVHMEPDSFQRSSLLAPASPDPHYPPLLQNEDPDDEDDADTDEQDADSQDEEEEKFEICSPNFYMDAASRLSEVYQLGAQVDSLVYKTVLEQEVYFQEAGNLKSSLLSPAQKENPINLLMTIEEQSAEEEQPETRLYVQQHQQHQQHQQQPPPDGLQNIEDELASMLRRSSRRLEQFSAAQKGIVDYYKQIVRGLRGELRVFAESLPSLEQRGQEELNAVRVERDLLRHQLEEQKTLEERLKQHYFEKMSALRAEAEEEASRQRQKHRQAKDELEEQVERLEDDRRKLGRENRALQAEAEELVRKRHSRTGLEELRRKLERAEEELDSTKHAKMAVQSSLEEQLAAKETQLGQLTRELKEKFSVVERSIEQALTEKQRAERECARYEQQRQQLEQDQAMAVTRVVSQASDVQKELMQREFDLKDREIEIEALEKDLRRARDASQKKEEALRGLEGELAEIRDCYQIVLNERDLAVEKLEASEQGHQNVLVKLQSELAERQTLLERKDEQLGKKQELEQLVIRASKDLRHKEQEISSFRKQGAEMAFALQELDVLQNSYAGLETKYQALADRFKALEKLRFDESAASKALFEEKRSLAEQNSQLSIKIEQLCNHGDALKNKYTAQQGELRRVKEEVMGGLEKDLQRKEAALAKAQTVITKLNTESQKVSDELAQAEDRVAKFKAENKELVLTNSQLAQRASAGESLKNISDQVAQENAKLKKAIAEAEQALQDAEHAWHSERQQILQEMAHSQQAFKQLEDAHFVLQQDSGSMREALAQMEEQLNAAAEERGARDQAEQAAEQAREECAAKEAERVQVLEEQLGALQKHASKAFCYLVSKFPRPQQEKMARSNAAVAKMLHSLDGSADSGTAGGDEYELREFLAAARVGGGGELGQTGGRMKKYAKILTTTSRHSLASSARTAEFEPAETLPHQPSVETILLGGGGSESAAGQESSAALLESKALMNAELRGECDRLAEDRLRLESELEALLEKECERLKEKLETAEERAQESQAAEQKEKDKEKEKEKEQHRGLEEKEEERQKKQMVVMEAAHYAQVVGESRARLQESAEAMRELRRGNAALKETVQQVLGLLRAEGCQGEELEEVLMQTVRHEQGTQRKSAEIALLRDSLAESEVARAQAEDEAASLRDKLAAGSSQIEKLLEKGKRRSEIVEQSLAIVYNLNRELREALDRGAAVPPLSLPIRKADEGELFAQVKEQARLVECALAELSHMRGEEDGILKRQSTYEAALKQLETELILEKRKVQDAELRYEEHLLHQEAQWQKQRASLLEQLRAHLANPDAPLPETLEPLDRLLKEKNEQLASARSPMKPTPKKQEPRGAEKCQGEEKENKGGSGGAFDLGKVQRLQREYRSLKERKEKDKRRYKRRAQEFESVLRLLELKMAHLTGSRREMQEYARYDQAGLAAVKREMAGKNPNLAQWLFMMESYLQRAENCVRVLRSAFHWIHGSHQSEPLHVFVCELGTNYRLQEQFDAQLLDKSEKLDRLKELVTLKLANFDPQLQEMPPMLREEPSEAQSAEQFLLEIKGTLDFDAKHLREYLHSTKHASERGEVVSPTPPAPALFFGHATLDETVKPGALDTTPSVGVIQEAPLRLGDTQFSESTRGASQRAPFAELAANNI